jgi:hypothetical protein
MPEIQFLRIVVLLLFACFCAVWLLLALVLQRVIPGGATWTKDQ